MNRIKIHTHLESETITIPELRPLVGKDVEIIVSEEPGRHSRTLLEFLQSWEEPPVDLDAVAQLREISRI